MWTAEKLRITMASTSSKLSLKRQRSHNGVTDSTSTIIKQQSGIFQHAIIGKTDVRAGDDRQQSIYERTECCDKGSRGRFIKNRKLSFRAMIVTLTIILLSSRNTFGFVNGKLDHRQVRRENRSNLNLFWEEGEHEGNDTFLSQSRGRDIKQGGYKANEKRGLEEILETINRQWNDANSTGDILPSLRIDSSSQPPSETNVTSDPQPAIANKLVDYGDSIKKNNPLIQSTLPINFKVDLVVKEAITNELLKGLETTLENHIQSEYQELVDRGSTGNKQLLNA